MTKIENLKDELEDEIKSITRKRDKLLVEVNDIGKELGNLLEKYYALDENMVAIKCPRCKGMGYLQDNKGNKQLCDTCGGPDKPYIWMEKYEPRKSDS
jgi:phage FluMu protein Com